MGCAAGGPLRGIEAGVAEALAPENCGGGTWQSSMTAQCVEEAAVRLTHGQEYDGEGARTPNALHGGQRWTNHQPRQARWRRLQGWRSSPAAFQMRVLPSWGRGGGFARSPIGHGEGIVERTDPLRQGGDVDVIEEGGGCREPAANMSRASRSDTPEVLLEELPVPRGPCAEVPYIVAAAQLVEVWMRQEQPTRANTGLRGLFRFQGLLAPACEMRTFRLQRDAGGAREHESVPALSAPAQLVPFCISFRATSFICVWRSKGPKVKEEKHREGRVMIWRAGDVLSQDRTQKEGNRKRAQRPWAAAQDPERRKQEESPTALGRGPGAQKEGNMKGAQREPSFLAAAHPSDSGAQKGNMKGAQKERNMKGAQREPSFLAAAHPSE
ncbi:hypothetical protein AK812_SmicGene15432 [Symbiodinium microadriaticum]|uniref:Uncharacterized protein n=1 Tax=Symbiodinium microadriaticum TaxID=2951 RepID=A0A1Q9E2U1_SYMMI|nr:hypothetical protein AK812_SmicGene15432 [Symbiodinium microadriaticum]